MCKIDDLNRKIGVNALTGQGRTDLQGPAAAEKLEKFEQELVQMGIHDAQEASQATTVVPVQSVVVDVTMMKDQPTAEVVPQVQVNIGVITAEVVAAAQRESDSEYDSANGPDSDTELL